jgi:hypothetical protein
MEQFFLKIGKRKKEAFYGWQAGKQAGCLADDLFFNLDQVDVLQMVISSYYLINSMFCKTVNISYGKYNPCIAFLHQFGLIPACVQVMKQPSSEKWHIATGLWSIIDACWFMNRRFVAIYYHICGWNDLSLYTLAVLLRWKNMNEPYTC